MSARAEFAGGLRERIRIERRSCDGEAWRCLGNRWASVSLLSGAASAGAQDTVVTARRWKIMLRAGLPLVLDDRLVWKNRLLRLSGILDDPATPDRLVLLAEEWGPSGL